MAPPRGRACGRRRRGGPAHGSGGVQRCPGPVAGDVRVHRRRSTAPHGESAIELWHGLHCSGRPRLDHRRADRPRRAPHPLGPRVVPAVPDVPDAARRAHRRAARRDGGRPAARASRSTASWRPSTTTSRSGPSTRPGCARLIGAGRLAVGPWHDPDGRVPRLGRDDRPQPARSAPGGPRRSAGRWPSATCPTCSATSPRCPRSCAGRASATRSSGAACRRRSTATRSAGSPRTGPPSAREYLARRLRQRPRPVHDLGPGDRPAARRPLRPQPRADLRRPADPRHVRRGPLAARGRLRRPRRRGQRVGRPGPRRRRHAGRLHPGDRRGPRRHGRPRRLARRAALGGPGQRAHGRHEPPLRRQAGRRPRRAPARTVRRAARRRSTGRPGRPACWSSPGAGSSRTRPTTRSAPARSTPSMPRCSSGSPRPSRSPTGSWPASAATSAARVPRGAHAVLNPTPIEREALVELDAPRAAPRGRAGGRRSDGGRRRRATRRPPGGRAPGRLPAAGPGGRPARPGSSPSSTSRVARSRRSSRCAPTPASCTRTR